MTWNLNDAGTNRPRKLAHFAYLCDQFFEANKVDIATYEAPLRLQVMAKTFTPEDTILMLRGAIGVFEASAARANIQDIRSFDVKDARHHFIGARTVKRSKSGKSNAKAEVMKWCGMLGYKVRNDNEADALAGWSYTCGLANPRIAHLVTPLFAGAR